jgi:hypothetical protein
VTSHQSQCLGVTANCVYSPISYRNNATSKHYPTINQQLNGIQGQLYIVITGPHTVITHLSVFNTVETRYIQKATRHLHSRLRINNTMSSARQRLAKRASRPEFTSIDHQSYIKNVLLLHTTSQVVKSSRAHQNVTSLRLATHDRAFRSSVSTPPLIQSRCTYTGLYLL